MKGAYSTALGARFTVGEIGSTDHETGGGMEPRKISLDQAQ